MKLYELTSEYSRVMDTIECAEGEITTEIEAWLNQVQESIETKTESICKIIANMNAEALGLEDAICRLQRRLNARAQACRKLKDYLFRNLESAGLTKVEASLWTVRVQKNSLPTVNWTKSTEEIPELFSEKKISLNKSLALKFWKQGLPLPDGFEVTEGSHLRIT